MEYVPIGLLAIIAVLLALAVQRLGGVRSDVERLDGRLGELEALRSLSDRLTGIEERLESLRPPPPPDGEVPPEPVPVTVQVDIAEDLREAVRSAVEEMERDLKKILRLAGRSRKERIGSMITRRLLDEGYRKVRITAGLPRTRSARSRVRVPVDAERDGMAHRGVVILRGAEIEETRLSPLHRMFP